VASSRLSRPRQQGQQPPEQPEPPGAEFLSKTKAGEQFDPAKFGLNPMLGST
jgi:hypothetical protein